MISTKKYEIKRVGGWGEKSGYKVLCYLDLPQLEEPSLISTRFFESKYEAENYIKYMEEHVGDDDVTVCGNAISIR